MSLNQTPAANRVHIGLFGRRNAGKSSLINALTNQDLAIVSDIPGTTTDPVQKAMEILPLGPVMLIDTAGIDDDEQGLGEKRIAKSKAVLEKIDIGLLIIDAREELSPAELDLIKEFEQRAINYLLVYNKSDLLAANLRQKQRFYASALTGENIDALRQKIAELKPAIISEFPLVSDIIKPKDMLLLVIPVDSAAPKGRLILPQQQVIRDILDSGAMATICQVSELEDTLSALKELPRLIITDSQVFGEVVKKIDAKQPLTSFSILFARHKGVLNPSIAGIEALTKLKSGAKILIAEGCSHHRQCEDIGTVKLPRWIKQFTGLDLDFDFSSGGGFPDDLTKYQLIVHCGACMLPPRVMQYRLRLAEAQNVPITNYGLIIAHMQGILERSLEALPLKPRNF